MLELNYKRIAKRSRKNQTIFEVGTGAWYLEDINRIFHPFLKSLEDAEHYTKQKGQTPVYGVYLRADGQAEIEISQTSLFIKNAVEEAIKTAEVSKKIGKGTVKDGELTRETGGTSRSEHLKDLCFIPCDSELSALMLEYILQIIFGRPKRTQALADHPRVKEAIDRKFSKRFDFWKPVKKGRYKSQSTGTEFFKPTLKLELFREIVNGLTTDYKDAGLNKIHFPTIERDYQGIASDVFVDCAIQVGSLELAIESIDFYLLMKPRSGKNVTILRALAKYYKKGQTLGWFDKSKVIEVLWTSLVPSAFPGTWDDIDKYWFDKDIKISYVDTSKPDWEEQRLTKINQGANIVILFSSMQSIDEMVNKQVARDWKTAETLDVSSEDFDKKKLDKLLKLKIPLMILDESDFGLRTELSLSVINKFNPKIKMHLSGSDLYAIRNKTTDKPVPNYYLRDVIAEDKDIDQEKVKMPKLRYWFMEVGLLPFDDMSPDEMDEKQVSRCLRNLYLTNVDRFLENMLDENEITKVRKYKRDPHSGLWLDGLGREIKLENEQEMRRFKKLIENLENAGFRLLEHRHIFNTVPTQVGQLAFENFCIKNGWFDYDVKTGYEFGNAGKRQAEVKDWMGISEHNPKGIKKTWFVTVAKMLRGATVPWSAVVRCDEFSDFKIGHQIDLRSQNEYGPDELHCDILDMNPWRRKRSQVELMKMSSRKGDKFKLLQSTANRLMPWCIGATGIRQSTMEETEEAYNNFRSLTHGFQSANLYDLDKVLQDIDILKDIGTVSRDNGETDPRSGKKKKKKKKKVKQAKKKKPSKDEKAKALKLIKNFANYMPLLQFVSRNDTRSNTAYYTLSDLLEFSKKKLLKQWFGYVGLPKDIDNEIILSWFDQDKFNERLRITANMINRGLDIEEIGQISKPKAGDVPVPYVLAKKIVDGIPDAFWKKPDLKIFDPSCGKGDFLKVIKDKLESLGFSKKQIGQTIYYADPEPFNVITTNKILDLDNGFSYNILTKPKGPDDEGWEEFKKAKKQNKNFSYELKELEEKIDKLFVATLKMKFDLYITNPPYQSTNEKGERNDQAKNLWSKFVKLGHDITKDGGIFCLVTPNNWMSVSSDIGKGPKGIKFYKDYFQKYKVSDININDCKKYFKKAGVDAGTSFSYFVVEKTESKKFTTRVKSELDEFDIDLRDVPLLPKEISKDNIDILKKFFFSGKEIMQWRGNNTPEASLDGIETSDKPSKKFKYKIYSRPAKGGTYFYRADKMENFDKAKVIISESGHYKPVYDDGQLGYDHFGHVYILKDGETIENIKSVLEHPLYKWGMNQTQLVGFLTSMSGSIPALDFTKKWKHQEVYDEFNISQDQREKIDDRHR